MDATTEGIEQGRRQGHAHPEPRRRPSGEPPALPHELGRSGKFFLLLVLYFVLVITAFLVFPSLESVFERWDHTRQLLGHGSADARLTRVMLVVNGLASSWTIRVIRWGVILALIVFRRWRHLFVFLGALIVTEIVGLQRLVDHRAPAAPGDPDPHRVAGVLDAVEADGRSWRSRPSGPCTP